MMLDDYERLANYFLAKKHCYSIRKGESDEN